MGQKYKKNIISEAGPKANLLLDQDCLLYATLGVTSKDTLDTIGKVGTNETENQRMAQAKALNKAVTDSINGSLLSVHSPLKSRYLSAYNCSQYYFQNGNKLHTHRCRQRTCLVCDKIRVSKALRQYDQAFKNMAEPYMVTLTFGRIENLGRQNAYFGSEVTHSSLREIFKSLSKDLSDVMRSVKISLKRSGREDYLVNAVSAFECSINPIKRKPFHPHFHMVVDGYDKAVMIVDAWIKNQNRGGHSIVNKAGQDITKAYDLKDVFKYITKMLSKHDFSPVLFDAVQRAVSGQHTIKNYGLCKPAKVKVNDNDLITADWLPDQVEVYKWHRKKYDYFDLEGNAMTGLQLTDDDRYLIKNKKYRENPKA
mgnify:CR=1 FL=1|jgi:hypothetical protein